MTVAHQLAEKGITIYMVGCEPSISPYKEFFMAVAYITGIVVYLVTHTFITSRQCNALFNAERNNFLIFVETDCITIFCW